MNLRLLLFCMCVAFSIHVSTSKKNVPRVTTPLGKIRGYYRISANNRIFKTFTSVPYAKPPVQERRLQPPEPISPWAKELDATKRTVMCIQYNFMNDDIKGVEDCLYLNVYVPKVNNSQPLPVIFYVHGGAYQSGDSASLGPKYLMDKDVILVTPNYRVGPLGFLSTGDEILPGNYALKDQSLALRWTFENIKYFGGDPKRITLAGCSAGGSSVHYHYFSPLSAGLFQNGISLSGNALSPWALSKNPMADTVKLASILNCPTNSSNEIVRCLKQLPAHEICKAAYKLLWSEYLPFGIDRPPFRPVVEKIKEGYFINRTPEEILESNDVNDVPWIAGAVSAEGIIHSHGFVFNQTSLSYIDKNWEATGPYILFLHDHVPKERHVEIAKAARQHYFDNESFVVSDKILKTFVRMTGDKNFVYDMERAAVLQAKANKSPVQVYYYNYRAANSMSDVLLKTNKDYGVCHADDSMMVLDNHIIDPTSRLEDMQMTKILVNMWYTLAKKGQADVGMQWPKVKATSKYLQYLLIEGVNKLSIKYNDNLAERKFWEKMEM